MAKLGATALTLVDAAKRTDPNGKIPTIAELLNDTNEILTDMAWVQSNLPTGHQSTIRTGLPTVAWRLLNYGVQPSKSRTAQVTDTCGLLEAWAEVDEKILELNGNTQEFRTSEDAPFLEAMSQEMASTLFYGNVATDPQEFTGLSPRYSSLSAQNGKNIVNAGGSGSDNTSIWLVTWHDQTCFGIYPKGSTAGLKQNPRGKETKTDTNGGLLIVDRTQYTWEAGLVLKDWRYVARIANIDTSDLNASASGASANLITCMIKALHKIPTKGRGRMVWYANTTIYTWLDLQTLNRSNNFVSYGQDVHGQPVLTFRGIPVRKCDALVDTEATVS